MFFCAGALAVLTVVSTRSIGDWTILFTWHSETGNFFFGKRIWLLLELICRRTENFTIIDQEKHKSNKFTFRTLWLPDLLCKHWFTSSVRNFCHLVADVTSGEKSPSGEEQGETAVFTGHLVTVPQVFVKVNQSQFPSYFWHRELSWAIKELTHLLELIVPDYVCN